MKKKVLGLAAVAALTAGVAVASLTGCSAKHYLNVRVWNDEFVGRFRDYYPEIKEETKKGEEFLLKNGTIVRFITVANKDNAYQNALDTALKAQSTTEDNEKVDMFLFEADYALKYVNSDYTMDIKDLGITENDTKEMYQYTKDIATANGKLKGLSWQATPGLFAYRTDIAEDVLGTSDPAEVQKKLADWDKFDEVAVQMKAKNYAMLAGYDDAYRTFSNNIAAPLVNSNNEIVIDENINRWIEQTKEYSDNGYNNKASLWDNEWAKQQTINGNTFGFFYSTWGINFTLAENAAVKNDAGKNLVGKYKVCYGPQSYYWGGTWIAAATGTDDKDLIKDIMLKLTCDGAIAEKITRDTQDYTNNKSAMNKIANDKDYGSELLGGQNHIALFTEAAPKINMKNVSPYDQGINENIQNAMKDYFTGKVDLETAWANFYTKIKDVYPTLKKKA